MNAPAPCDFCRGAKWISASRYGGHHMIRCDCAHGKYLAETVGRIITPAELRAWHLDNQQRAHMSPSEKRANSPGRKAA